MITLNINGQDRETDLPGDTPLLWTLRDRLGLRGTKFGCGMGLCGACTVHIDGHARRSCITPIASLAGKKVRTIEGLSADGLHPVQSAWIEERVPQCGFCQPGQVMTASSFLAENATPSEEDIAVAMSGNICRCGTYQRIRLAVRRAADEMAKGEGK